MSRWQWIFKQLTRRLWLRASLIGLLGILTAILAAVVEPYIPWHLPGAMGADSIDSILTIIASSMLSVTTFSLSVMTSAYGAATSNVTPRATRLLMEDRTTQNVLSTFIGSFLFGIVGIIVLQTGAYGERGRVILFAVTLGVIALIVISLLRWIDHLTRLGRVGETTDRVERATEAAMRHRLALPYLGGRKLAAGLLEPPAQALIVTAGCVGYVQHIDMPALTACSERGKRDIHVLTLPGTFVYGDTPLLWMDRPSLEGEEIDAFGEGMRRAFTIGNERSFDQDPRFGLAVMSEIASRAMSPGVNDSGTAIDVIGRMTRLMDLWGQGPTKPESEAVDHPNIHVPPLSTADLFEDAFMLIARDGAGLVEVQIRLRKALAALARKVHCEPDFCAAAVHQADLAWARADAALTLKADRERLRQVEL
ncbi:DUF2254 domain-containing protein [Niveispirillum irakense]|uniref:DUF2254 domain-containing protein n=1 Tax=Niveispirillum irakense TaxID=34011 RepID=UPI00040C65A0|nr:DUF2254 domain-containing protein [Niveispirillum irakense]